jgi:hypothetical protein
MDNAAKLVRLHSGGKCGQALKMYMAFKASGETPEPLDSQCEWLEMQANLMNVPKTTTASNKPEETASQPSSKWEELPKNAGKPKTAQVSNAQASNVAATSSHDTNGSKSAHENSPSAAAKQNDKYQEQYMNAISPTKGSDAIERTGIEVPSEEEGEMEHESTFFCFCCRKSKKILKRGEQQSLLH